MKKLLLPAALAIIGFAIYQDNKSWSVGPSDNEKKQSINKLFSNTNEAQFMSDFLNKISSDELNTIYEIMVRYKHVNNAPIILQNKWNAISVKYNVFT